MHWALSGQEVVTPHDKEVTTLLGSASVPLLDVVDSEMLAQAVGVFRVKGTEAARFVRELGFWQPIVRFFAGHTFIDCRSPKVDRPQYLLLAGPGMPLSSMSDAQNTPLNGPRHSRPASSAM